jgi:dCMP deaminase
MASPKPLSEPDRIPIEEVYMRMAEELAKRSTCARLQVGSVITTADLTQVLGIGYNGNAKGLPNRCDTTQPGNCGCLHAETNAVIKAGAQLPGKVMFISASPCVMCAKMIINANVGRVYYRECAISQPESVWIIRGSTAGTAPSLRTRRNKLFTSASRATDSSTFLVA